MSNVKLEKDLDRETLLLQKQNLLELLQTLHYQLKNHELLGVRELERMLESIEEVLEEFDSL